MILEDCFWCGGRPDGRECESRPGYFHAGPYPVPTFEELEEWHEQVEKMVEEMFGPDAPDAHYWKHVEQFKGRKEVDA